MLIKLIHGNADLYPEINKDARKCLLQQFLKIKSGLKQHKSTIIKEESSLIKQINSVAQKTLELVKLQVKKLDEIILKVKNLERIDNLNETTFIKSILKISSTDLSKIQLIKCTSLDIRAIDSKNIKKLFKLEELSEENFLLDIRYENKKLFKWIKKKKNILWTFNAETKNLEKKDLPIKIDLGIYSGNACFLPDGSIFYYNLGKSIIIDPSSAIKYLPKWELKARYAHSVYKNGFIYLFGDARDAHAKFNIAENKWTPILKFAIDSFLYFHPFIFKDYILLPFKNGGLFCYDTIIDSISDFSQRSALFPKKYFTVNETLYLIDYFGKMYRMTDNLLEWNEIKGLSLEDYHDLNLIESPIIYNREYYYIGAYNTIVAFDLRNKKDREVCKIPES